jgi:predicted transcriptional regulator
MKAIELNVPDDVYSKLQDLASRDHQSIDGFARQKLEEFVHAFEAFAELEHRAKRGNRKEFESSMAKVPKVPPIHGDEL